MDYENVFTEPKLKEIFSPDRADDFFEALYGDAAEGSYDIELVFVKGEADRLNFEFRLHQRTGKCLRCNLTYGLPKVFSRHPVIGVAGVIDRIDQELSNGMKTAGWRLGDTREDFPKDCM